MTTIWYLCNMFRTCVRYFIDENYWDLRDIFYDYYPEFFQGKYIMVILVDYRKDFFSIYKRILNNL